MTTFKLPEPVDTFTTHGPYHTRNQLLQVRRETLAEVVAMWEAPWFGRDGRTFIQRLRALARGMEI